MEADKGQGLPLDAAAVFKWDVFGAFWIAGFGLLISAIVTVVIFFGVASVVESKELVLLVVGASFVAVSLLVHRDMESGLFSVLAEYFDKNVRGYTYWVHRVDGVIHESVSRDGKYSPVCQKCYQSNDRRLYIGIALGGWFRRSRCLDLSLRTGIAQMNNPSGVQHWRVIFSRALFAHDTSVMLIDPSGVSLRMSLERVFDVLEVFQQRETFGISYPAIVARLLARWVDWEQAAAALLPHHPPEGIAAVSGSYATLKEPIDGLLREVRSLRGDLSAERINQQGHLLRLLDVARSLADTSRLGKSKDGRRIRLDVLRMALLMRPDPSQAERIEREMDDIKDKIAKAEKRAESQAKRKKAQVTS